jgi:hypothetical protein
MAGGLGFEPRLAESESAVLPLDDPPTIDAWLIAGRRSMRKRGVGPQVPVPVHVQFGRNCLIRLARLWVGAGSAVDAAGGGVVGRWVPNAPAGVATGSRLIDGRGAVGAG